MLYSWQHDIFSLTRVILRTLKQPLLYPNDANCHIHFYTLGVAAESVDREFDFWLSQANDIKLIFVAS